MKLQQLTGLRFIAAYIVMLSHVFGVSSPLVDAMGRVSVQIFFVLSGFVMYINYENRIINAKISFYKFFCLRVARMYPVYVLSITVFLIMMLYRKLDSFNNLSEYYFISIAMIQSYLGDMKYAFNPVNSVSWSVSDEMFFYTMFFIALSALGSRKMFTVFIIGYILISYVLIYFCRNGLLSLSFKWLFYINPVYRLNDFFMGCIVGMLYHKWKDCIVFQYDISLVLIFFLLTTYLSQMYVPLYDYWYSNIIVSICSAYLIFLLACSTCGVFTRFLSNKLMILLGEASYSLYLFHVFILFLIISPYLYPKLKNYIYLYHLVQLTVPVLFSIMIYKYFEYPIYKYLRSKIVF